jgi:hypothetical protein
MLGREFIPALISLPHRIVILSETKRSVVQSKDLQLFLSLFFVR